MTAALGSLFKGVSENKQCGLPLCSDPTVAVDSSDCSSFGGEIFLPTLFCSFSGHPLVHNAILEFYHRPRGHLVLGSGFYADPCPTRWRIGLRDEQGRRVLPGRKVSLCTAVTVGGSRDHSTRPFFFTATNAYWLHQVRYCSKSQRSPITDISTTRFI